MPGPPDRRSLCLTNPASVVSLVIAETRAIAPGAAFPVGRLRSSVSIQLSLRFVGAALCGCHFQEAAAEGCTYAGMNESTSEGQSKVHGEVLDDRSERI